MNIPDSVKKNSVIIGAMTANKSSQPTPKSGAAAYKR